MVSVSYNLKFSVGRVFECPVFEFELDFERKTPHSTPGQRCPPMSAVGNVSADFRWQGITHENSTVPVTLKDLYDEKKVLEKTNSSVNQNSSVILDDEQNGQKNFQNFEFQATYVCNRRRKQEIEKGLE